jgi:hypothetical protein
VITKNRVDHVLLLSAPIGPVALLALRQVPTRPLCGEMPLAEIGVEDAPILLLRPCPLPPGAALHEIEVPEELHPPEAGLEAERRRLQSLPGDVGEAHRPRRTR